MEKAVEAAVAEQAKTIAADAAADKTAGNLDLSQSSSSTDTGSSDSSSSSGSSLGGGSSGGNSGNASSGGNNGTSSGGNSGSSTDGGNDTPNQPIVVPSTPKTTTITDINELQEAFSNHETVIYAGESCELQTLIVPESKTLVIGNGTSAIVVAVTETLDNRGSITIQDSELLLGTSCVSTNNGTIEDNGKLTNNGVFHNHGSIKVSKPDA